MSTTLSKIADTSSDLYNTHKKFNTTVKSHKWERMQDVYASLNQAMATWGRSWTLTFSEQSLKRQIETMKGYMDKTFKYTSKEFESFNEVVKLRNATGQEYFKFWVDLENKKQRLFVTGDVTKWEIDFKEVKLTPEDVLKNQKVAKVLMLPAVSRLDSNIKANGLLEANAESVRLHEHADA